VFTVGEIGGSENPVGFDHFVRSRCRIKDISEPVACAFNDVRGCERTAP
jgi:hypothetical protein